MSGSSPRIELFAAFCGGSISRWLGAAGLVAIAALTVLGAPRPAGPAGEARISGPSTSKPPQPKEARVDVDHADAAHPGAEVQATPPALWVPAPRPLPGALLTIIRPRIDLEPSAGALPAIPAKLDPARHRPRTPRGPPAFAA